MGGLALPGLGIVLLVGGLSLSFLVWVIAPGMACMVGDEIYCFATSATAPSPFHALGLASAIAGAVLLIYAVFRKEPL